jgi:hypothetical protein
MMTIRSARLIASTWSWVTKTKVAPRRCVQVLQLRAQLRAQLGVEVRQRLVEQEHRRLAHDGAAHGDALALAARERAGLAVEIRSICSMRAASAMRFVDLGFGMPWFFSPYSMFLRTDMCG